MEHIKIFDKYQRKSLLPSIGGSDDIYDNLLKSADEIAEDLAKNPSKIITYTLVGLDNEIIETEPVLVEVENAISTNWKMVRSKFEEMPIPLYRAIILQALENLVIKDSNFATIIWFAGIDVYPHLDIPKKEQDVLIEFLKELGEKAEDRAISEWSIVKSDVELKIPKLNLKLTKISGKIDLEKLTESLVDASGLHGKDNVKREGANTVWSNSGASWAYHFAPNAAEGIATETDKALTKVNDGVNDNIKTLQKELVTYFEKVKTNVENSLKEATQSSVAVEQRSQVLWWKEALYSKKLQKSYRKFSKFQNSIAMAVDLYWLLPNIFPISVDSILKETFGSIHGYEEEKVKLIDFLNEINDSRNEDFLKTFFDETEIPNGRIDFESFIKKIIFSKVNIEKEVMNRLGISPAKEMSYEEISVWILHCMSAKHLTSK